MIIPARWYAGGKGLDDFRAEMLSDDRIRILHDYPIASDCFSGVEIKGGICYFLWDRGNRGNCNVLSHKGSEITSEAIRPLKEEGLDIFIRYNEATSILHKVQSFNEKSFSEIVSARKPFGLDTTYKAFDSNKPIKGYVRLYANNSQGFILKTKLPKGKEFLDKWKIYISRAYGAGEDFPHQILNIPFIGDPNSACTETYLVIGPFKDEQECKNVMSYIATRFFRFLVLQKKNTQDATQGVYQFVPIQDFSKSWTDKELYKKYNLTKEEIAFIESMIRPMDINTDETQGEFDD